MGSAALVGYLLLFIAVGVGFIFIHLVMGMIVRPRKPHAEKLTIYECGEPTVGSAWVQFDLRYYVVALLFVIFDVEVAFFFPWAVVFGQANALAITNEASGGTPSSESQLAKRELLDLRDPSDPQQPLTRPFTEQEQNIANNFGSRLGLIALLDIGVFFGVLLVGFAYLWKRGDLQWVKTTVAERLGQKDEGEPEAEPEELVGAGQEATP
jgi:NADH-quinone oxidoreductase subunit A